MVGSAVSAGVMVLMEKWGSRYIDDTLDVFACHGVGGTTGTILFSLLSTKTVNDAGVDGAYYGKWGELGVTLLVLVCVIAYVLAATWAILWFTNKLIRLRVSDLELLEGLDKSKHGERAMAVAALMKEMEEASHDGSATAHVRATAPQCVTAVPSIMGDSS
ncbi:hypothetical protein OEZ85_010728 [Tetradesmus obliquus]|uniref:Ammonium transporter AmtB-like domain-containing protein n=1 Tax=Tetradesmus obliquus TaxID=3088 RepID=A0ABY8TN58_TETOB|nr:hypothetical protein OEZ85_010728 [Tetradesmus obliquus]